jgi:hypothetical protein
MSGRTGLAVRELVSKKEPGTNFVSLHNGVSGFSFQLSMFGTRPARLTTIETGQSIRSDSFQRS